MAYDNREDIKTLPLLWQHLLRLFSLDLENCLPAVVLSYDRAKNVVTCRPAINRLTVNEESITRTELVLPCLNLAGNGIGINFPLKPGDTGWMIAADRDTTNFKSTREVVDPNTGNLHSYAFGFFIPDQVSGFEIDDEDADALVIQTLDGKTKISVAEGQIAIISDADVEIVGGDSVNINTTAANITAEIANIAAPVISISGGTGVPSDISVVGTIALTGSMTASGDITADNVSLVGHVHLTPDEAEVMTGRPQQQE